MEEREERWQQKDDDGETLSFSPPLFGLRAHPRGVCFPRKILRQQPLTQMDGRSVATAAAAYFPFFEKIRKKEGN